MYAAHKSRLFSATLISCESGSEIRGIWSGKQSGMQGVCSRCRLASCGDRTLGTWSESVWSGNPWGSLSASGSGSGALCESGERSGSGSAYGGYGTWSFDGDWYA